MNNLWKRARTMAPIAALAIAAPAIAHAATGFTDGRTVMYAGPGDDYPRVETLRNNTPVRIHGCIARYDWCDVSVGRMHGWVEGDDLKMRYRGRPVTVEGYGPRMSLPTLTFRFDSYWDNNYRRSGFYRDRNNWRERAMRDQDRDGVPNRIDRDRDGDGTPNRRDRAPNNSRVD